MFIEHPDEDQPDLYVPEPDDRDDEDFAALEESWAGADLRGPGDADEDEPRILGLVALPTGIKSSSRNGAPVLWIVAHTAEGARTARSLGAFFAQSSVQASSHVGIDATEVLAYVAYSRAAWTLRSGNPWSENAELCGFARWTRAQWLSTGTVDGCVNPRKILDNFAAWAKSRCKARGIDPKHLTLTRIRSRTAKGVIDHDDYSKATGDGTHWDCGPNFPWDYVLDKIQGKDDDMPGFTDRFPLSEAQDADIPGDLKDMSFAAGLGYGAAGYFQTKQVEEKLDAHIKKQAEVNAKILAALTELKEQG